MREDKANFIEEDITLEEPLTYARVDKTTTDKSLLTPKKENLALFGVEEIEITQEDLKKAKLENKKDKEALDIPIFT